MSYIKQLSTQKEIALTTLCDSLQISRATLYRNQENNLQPLTNAPLKPHNAMSDEERQTILDVLHSERFMDCTPYDVFYTLLDEGQYIGSIRSLYRVLLQAGGSNDRRQQRRHRDAVKPELIATRPNEVWSWDITKCLSVNRLEYYHLYVILDIFSRYVVGWMLAERECQHLAKILIQKTTLKYGIQPGQLTIHSDNGPSMRSQTVATLLDKIGVSKTHNRPYTSNDNPFSESQFKTLKYCPQFPERFESLAHAEKFCRDFFQWYNNEHYHSGILFLKPISVHRGQAEPILQNRYKVLLQAYENNPARFNNKIPTLKKLKPVYINPPSDGYEKSYLQQGEFMV
ncbi:MAG: IS3 family transposase, partial [Chitinophagaceae bacterium]|nr:IS3 family transposase [Legionellales bacterium]MCW5930024.1 IS3 family transposase [Chitinophagaceae bacterium]